MVSRRLEKPVSLRYNACPMAIPAKDFVSLLQDVGFDFFTGVPDSTLGGIIATLIERRVHLPAARAGAAGGPGGRGPLRMGKETALTPRPLATLQSPSALQKKKSHRSHSTA